MMAPTSGQSRSSGLKMLPEIPLESTVEGTILVKTRERLLALELPGIQDKVYIRKLPFDEHLQPPYVLVTPPPESTPWQEGTNEKDVANFAVMVAVVLANQRDLTQYMGLQLYWRERIRRKFQCKSRLQWSELADAIPVVSTGAYLVKTEVESGDKFIEAAWREQRDASYYLIRVQVREPRE